MYKDGEYAVVDNCLIENRKREGWSAVPPSRESAVEESAVESTEETETPVEAELPDWAQ